MDITIKIDESKCRISITVYEPDMDAKHISGKMIVSLIELCAEYDLDLEVDIG